MSLNRNLAAAATARIAGDVGRRSHAILTSAKRSIFAGVMLLPVASAQSQDVTGYTDINTTEHTYNNFIGAPVDNSTIDNLKILADITSLTKAANGTDWASWRERASQIRISGSPEFCVGNLSLALSGLGAAYQAGSAGATTLLTLVPTAGALIGAPAKELWVLYKLMPVAGVLSMLLSLGGNIVPMEVNQYERLDSFSYAGMVGSLPEERPTVPTDASSQQGKTEAEVFADEVHARALDSSGSNKSGVITAGIILQLFWLGCILTACWFIQSGSIIVWWCTVSCLCARVSQSRVLADTTQMKPWMYFWYVFVAITSLLDNLAGVPFTRQYTVRVCRAPKVRISDDAPCVIPERKSQPPPKSPDLNGLSKNTPAGPDDITVMTTQLTSSSTAVSDMSGQGGPAGGRYAPIPQGLREGDILDGLERGYNTVGRVVMDHSEPWAAQNNSFYVIISIRGITNGHATLRVCSKFLSIAVFWAGTALFASSTLVTILVAVVVATLTVVAGVFGRVTAMWMASEIMQNKPVIHRVVKHRYEAEQFIEAMLRKPNCLFEILGHLVVDGRCVKRFRRHLRWSKLLGVLAQPYDLTKLAMPHVAKSM